MEERLRDDFEKRRCGPNPGFRMPRENPADHGFHRSRRRDVEAAAARRELEVTATAVRRVYRPPDEPAALESLEDSRERARMETKDSRESTRRQPRRSPEHAQRHALGAGQAQRRLHSFGEGLEPVVERPDEPHEVEDLAELGSGVDSSRLRHAPMIALN